MGMIVVSMPPKCLLLMILNSISSSRRISSMGRKKLENEDSPLLNLAEKKGKPLLELVGKKAVLLVTVVLLLRRASWKTLATITLPFR